MGCRTCRSSCYTSRNVADLARAALLLCAAAASGAAAADARQRAEVQINVCSDPAQVVRALALGATGDATTVWLFDTDRLELHRQGLRLRLRQAGRIELTLKAAGQNCKTVDKRMLRPDGKCEADLHGDQLEDVVSLSRSLGRDELRTLLPEPAAPKEPLADALWAQMSSGQRDLFATSRKSSGGRLPRELRALGPSQLRGYRSSADDFVVEVWTLPKGQQFVELSQRATRDTAIALRARLLGRIASAGLTACADQQSQAGEKLRLLAE